jgi:hypothetical protein
VKRREFIAGLASAAAWPVVVRAQQPERMRRVGALWLGAVYDPTAQGATAGLREVLESLGWIEERNLRLEIRYAGNDSKAVRAYADELVRLAPDVIVTSTALVTAAAQQHTRTIPIVFAGVGDPVQNGMAKSLTRPQGNVTGITNLFPSIGSKWLELIKNAASAVARAAILIPEQSRGNYVSSSGRPDILWTKFPGSVPTHRRLCRQDSTRGEASRPSRRTRDLVARPAYQGLSENENGCARISIMAKEHERSIHGPEVRRGRVAAGDPELAFRATQSFRSTPPLDSF